MTKYRLYFMSPRTGHIDRFEEFEAPDDGQAISIAEDQLGEQPIELWAGHRKVRRYPYGPGFTGRGSWPPEAWQVAA